MGFIKRALGFENIENKAADSLIWWARHLGEVGTSKSAFKKHLENLDVEVNDKLVDLLKISSADFRIDHPKDAKLRASHLEDDSVSIQLVMANNELSPFSINYENGEIVLVLSRYNSVSFLQKGLVRALEERVDSIRYR